MLDESLVFDIGAHTGEDTDYYLGKGFRVVAVEANPSLVRKMRKRFSKQLLNQTLTIVSAAIGRFDTADIPFFVNPDKDDWSSVFKEVANKQTTNLVELRVPTISLGELFENFGVPRYMKVDIELGDTAVIESLLDRTERPKFVSAELHDIRILSLLAAAGYQKFQITNQWLNGFLNQVVPAREGSPYWPRRGMGGFHSGHFGEELPHEEWLGLEEAMSMFLANSVATKAGLMKSSWFDLHARLN